MKSAFVKSISDIMDDHDDAITVTADMGFSVFEELQKKYPKRFINTGVTEQASVSLAAGLALSGYRVFFYAQAAFATMRCFEQLRLDVAYNFLNVKVIGVNAGVSLNQLGVSHFSTEDIGLMRLLPNTTIFSPGDEHEMAWAMEKMYHLDGPAYLRYSKLGDQPTHTKAISQESFAIMPIIKGTDIVIFASGGIIQMAKDVVRELQKKNISASLVSVPVIKPIDSKGIIKQSKDKMMIFTMEEHTVIGGLGTTVTEVIAESDLSTKVHKFGIPDRFLSVTGSMSYLLSQCGLETNKIVKKIIKSVSK